MQSVPCPICKSTVSEDARAFPFCGERCRLIDLGNWLDGRYSLAGEEVENPHGARDANREDPDSG